MKVLYITSLMSVYANSGAIQNFGYINGIANIIGKANIDVMTIKWADNMYDRKMLEKTQVNDIFFDKVNVIEKYFGRGRKAYVDNVVKNSNFLKSFKKFLVETVYFPSVDKQWIKTYYKADFRKYDYIISSSDTKTCHFIAEKIKKTYQNIKWIQIWGDPWSTDITIGSLTKIRAKQHENRLLRKADSIFYVSKPTMEEMKEIYKESAYKMHYIPRGYAVEVVKEQNHKRDKKEIIMLYTGLLNKTRDISQFCSALNDSNAKSEIKIKVKIFGNVDNESANKIKNNQSIILCGVTDYFNILGEYKNCDALLYIGNPSGTTQIPGKLYDYLGTDNSVLALVYDDTDKTTSFLKSLGRVVVVPNNKHTIEEGIIKIKDQVLTGNLEPYKEFSSKNIMQEMFDTAEDDFSKMR